MLSKVVAVAREAETLGVLGVWHAEYNNDDGLNAAEFLANRRAGDPWEKPSAAAYRAVYRIPGTVYKAVYEYEEALRLRADP